MTSNQYPQVTYTNRVADTFIAAILDVETELDTWLCLDQQQKYEFTLMVLPEDYTEGERLWFVEACDTMFPALIETRNKATLLSLDSSTII